MITKADNLCQSFKLLQRCINVKRNNMIFVSNKDEIKHIVWVLTHIRTAFFVSKTSFLCGSIFYFLNCVNAFLVKSDKTNFPVIAARSKSNDSQISVPSHIIFFISYKASGL